MLEAATKKKIAADTALYARDTVAIYLQEVGQTGLS